MVFFCSDEDDLKEIRSIIIDTPYESDGLIQSWEDISSKDMFDSFEAGNALEIYPIAVVTTYNYLRHLVILCQFQKSTGEIWMKLLM